MHKKFQQIRDELTDKFVERDEVINGLICGLLSGQHTLLIGTPGTAKSALVDELCQRVSGANYFQWLLTKFSTPEELFGPISLKALEHDKYQRITTDKLPESHIAFCDEIFKANSAILNSLLTIINERKYHNNGHPVDVPLNSLVGASNELPDSEELGALYDRFMFRYQIDYIAGDGDFKKMMMASGASTKTTITLTELEQAQKEVEQIIITDDVFDNIISLRRALKEEGIIASDRRYRQSLIALKASAWMRGSTNVTDEDFEMYSHILWSQPSEHKLIKKTVMSMSNPIMTRVMELFDQADEIHMNCLEMARSDSEDGSTTSGVEANSKLKDIGESLNKALAEATKQNRDTTQIKDTIKKVSDMNRAILKECLGLDL